MDEKKKMHLSVGIFFNLILAARKRPVGRQEIPFKELLCIYDRGARGLTGQTLSSVASRTRNCKPSVNNEFLTFGEPMVVDALTERLRTSYDSVVAEMKKFADEHLDLDTYGEWLVRALLELIAADEDIREPDKFMVIPGNIPVYPEDLPAMEKIYFYNFLLGVWLYLCSSGKKENGAETYQMLSDFVGDSQARKFKPERIGQKECAPVCYDTELGNEEGTASKVLGKYIEALGGTMVVPEEKKAAGSLFEKRDGKEKEEPAIFIEFARVDKKAQEGRAYTYATYLKHAGEKHEKKKTFLYENQRPFYDFFVCNDLKMRTSSTGMAGANVQQQEKIEGATLDSFQKEQRFIILSGTGGLGKSMMMNHFMLDAIKKNGVNGRVPVFALLRDYNPQDGEIIDYIFREFKRHDPDLRLPDLIDLLLSGKAVILLDGLDEIKGENLETFYKELDMLVDSYPDSMYIISSRPNMNLRAFGRFLIFDLQPFSQTQALEMIGKLDESVVDPEIQEDFIQDLKKNRFKLKREEKKEFLGNPLFLTIMLLTYEGNHDIPTQRYLFYEQAYDAMAKKHDATKGLTREFATHLGTKDFQRIFGEFCAVTYEQEKYDFTQDEIEDYFWRIINANGLSVTPKDFIDDLTGKVCLLYKDGEKYYFVHRSFQEYFVAYFFSKQIEQNFDAVLEMMEERDDTDRDSMVLSMLHDMEPQKTELCIFIPFLRNIFDTGEENEYCRFLKRLYSVIQYDQGDTEGYSGDESESYIYDYIVNLYGLKKPVNGDELPVFEGMEDDAFVEILVKEPDDPYCYSRELVRMYSDRYPDEQAYIAEHGDYPEVVGRTYRFDVSDVQCKEYYEDVWRMIQEDDFPLKKEYKAMREKYFELKDAYDKKKEKKDFLSRFH